MGDLYSVRGGNVRLVEAMLAASKALVQLNSQVLKITRIGSDSSTGYEVLVKNEQGGPAQTIAFDHVIIATPLGLLLFLSIPLYDLNVLFYVFICSILRYNSLQC